MQHWLVKQEPEDYSWADFVADGQTAWTGVRNFQARKNLRAMKPGDLALYYHSGLEKAVVGIARVEKEAYRDPTADEGDWVAVDLKPVKAVNQPVSLAAVKAEPALSNIALVRQGRLSVSPLNREQFQHILKMGQTTGP